MTESSSLRERHRDQTRGAIHDAAVRLSAQAGFARVTIEAIAAEAGVSTRTFFNYFPSKEAAIILSPPVQLRGERADRFASGPVRDARGLLVELTQLLLEQLESDPPSRTASETVFAIAAENPAVFAALVGQLDTVRIELSTLIARRLPSGTGPQVASLIASLAMTAVRSGLESWAAEPPGGGVDSPVAHVRAAVDIIEDLTSAGRE